MCGCRSSLLSPHAASHSAHLLLHKLPPPPPPHILALRLPPPTAWEPDSLKRLGFMIFLHLTLKAVGPLVQQRFMEHLPW